MAPENPPDQRVSAGGHRQAAAIRRRHQHRWLNDTVTTGANSFLHNTITDMKHTLSKFSLFHYRDLWDQNSKSPLVNTPPDIITESPSGQVAAFMVPLDKWDFDMRPRIRETPPVLMSSVFSRTVLRSRTKSLSPSLHYRSCSGKRPPYRLQSQCGNALRLQENSDPDHWWRISRQRHRSFTEPERHWHRDLHCWWMTGYFE